MKRAFNKDLSYTHAGMAAKFETEEFFRKMLNDHSDVSPRDLEQIVANAVSMLVAHRILDLRREWNRTTDNKDGVNIVFHNTITHKVEKMVLATEEEWGQLIAKCDDIDSSTVDQQLLDVLYNREEVDLCHTMSIFRMKTRILPLVFPKVF